MLNLVPYLLKLSISLSVVYLFYLLCLRRLTFYTWNRWYLLLYTMICFIIPFVSLYSLFSKPVIEASPIVQYIPSIEEMTIEHTRAWITEPAFTMNIIYVVVIIAGMLFMLGRCLIQFYSLYCIRANAKLLYDNAVKLYHIDKPVVPFSFGNAIYINQHQHSQQELSEIIRHEFIHVKQRHSVDMIWSELLCIVNWYNPFAWLLRKAIRQNLEFIADHQVLQSGLDRKQYQYLLLKVIGTTSFSIASNFNFSSLKKRIAMMNKTKSARVNLLRFAFILPLLAVILLAFRNVVQQKQQPLPSSQSSGSVIIDTALVVADTVPVRNTFTMPDNVRSFDVEHKGTEKGRVTITLKNGEVERYDLSKEKDRKAFLKKYGDLPEPPVPPEPIVTTGDPHVVVAGTPAAAPVVADIAAPAAPAPSPVPAVDIASPVVSPVPPLLSKPPATNSDDCFNKKGYCITIADNEGECVVIVKNKQWKIVEAVTLTDWDKNKHYTEKYGDIPPVHIKVKPGAPAKPARAGGSGTMGTDGSHHGEAVADTAVVIRYGVPAVIEKEVRKNIVFHKAAVGDRIELIIDKNTTKEDIERIGKSLQEHDCSLIITSIEYQNGRVKNISGMIKSNDGRRRVEFSSGDITNGDGVLLVSNKGEKENNYLSVKTP